ncbi:hypothetical protein TSUD_295120 [Trifolium subterraneum]|uniref:Uncharacterized protein n=1 Tax=Trifolium subterraneum TaxID=3900 RepID=A0A2Z6MTY4_TRISU|nr:hypothetical protein TSUD_295120 [Trifolium subterraneum]
MEPVYMQSSSIWMSIYPKGIHDLLLYTKTKYNNPLIYITENATSLQIEEMSSVRLMSASHSILN